MIKKLDSFEAIVIDDISYVPYTRDETDVLLCFWLQDTKLGAWSLPAIWLFQIGKTSSRSDDYKGSIDRLVHHSTILELTESYRQKYAKNRKKAQEETKEPENT